MEQIVKYLSDIKIIIVLATLFLLGAVLLISKSSKKRKAKKTFDAITYRYNSLKSKPLEFKLRKASALARVGEDLKAIVDSEVDNYNKILKDLKQLNLEILNCEDQLELGKIKKARESFSSIHKHLDKIESEADSLVKNIDIVLEQEAQLRQRINKQKDIYRDIKQVVNVSASNLAFNLSSIDEKMKTIERVFSKFEDSMASSKFAQSEALLIEQAENLRMIKNLISATPEYVHNARVLIPEKVKIIQDAYSKARLEGCNLEILQVEKTITNLSQAIKEELRRIKLGDMENIDDRFKNYHHDLEELLENINKEHQSVLACRKIFGKLRQMMSDVQKKIEIHYVLSKKVTERFGVNHHEKELDNELQNIELYLTMLVNLEKELDNSSSPATSVFLRAKELEINFIQFDNGVERIVTQLKNFYEEEESAKESLIELNILVNEIIVSVRRSKINSMADSYYEDLAYSTDKLAKLKLLMENDNLEISSLHDELQEVTSFVYNFYNHVNETVGYAKFSEQTIVFLNRFRSLNDEIDDCITKAELAFQNGEYSNALSKVLPLAQKMFPDNFADLIKEVN
ncbi:MAG: septation ring formation regulator EzrA [Erysipelotrichaceae bacterium]